MHVHPNHSQFVALLERLGIVDQVLDIHALSGLALAICSAPDIIEPEEWFPLAFLDENGEVVEPEFASDADAEAFYGQLQLLADDWSETLARDEDIRLPAGCGLDADGEPSDALRDFCDGVAEINSDLAEVFDNTITACLLLNDPEATRLSLEQNDGIPLDEQMTNADAIEVFRTGMRILANFGRDVAALLEDEED